MTGRWIAVELSALVHHLKKPVKETKTKISHWCIGLEVFLIYLAWLAFLVTNAVKVLPHPTSARSTSWISASDVFYCQDSADVLYCRGLSGSTASSSGQASSCKVCDVVKCWWVYVSLHWVKYVNIVALLILPITCYWSESCGEMYCPDCGPWEYFL